MNKMWKSNNKAEVSRNINESKVTNVLNKSRRFKTNEDSHPNNNWKKPIHPGESQKLQSTHWSLVLVQP